MAQGRPAFSSCIPRRHEQSFAAAVARYSVKGPGRERCACSTRLESRSITPNSTSLLSSCDVSRYRSSEVPAMVSMSCRRSPMFAQKSASPAELASHSGSWSRKRLNASWKFEPAKTRHPKGGNLSKAAVDHTPNEPGAGRRLHATSLACERPRGLRSPAHQSRQTDRPSERLAPPRACRSSGCRAAKPAVRTG